MCKEREGHTPFCVYKYKGIVRGIEAKKIMGLKETKLLKLGDSCRRRDGTGFIMASHMQQVPSFWDKIPFNFFFLRSSFFLISLTQGTNLHYFFTLKCLSSLFLVALLLLLQPCHHFYHIQAALRPSVVIRLFLLQHILFLYYCCCCCSYCYCFCCCCWWWWSCCCCWCCYWQISLLSCSFTTFVCLLLLFLTLSLRLSYVPTFSKTCWFQAQEM